MTIDSKVNLLRRIERYKKRIDLMKENRKALIVAMQAEQVKLRAHYGDVVAEKLAKIRGLENQVSDLTTAAIQDRFKLQELENQVAVMYKDNAAFGQDLQSLNTRDGQQVQTIRELRKQLLHAGYLSENADKTIAELKQRISYRLWVAIATQASALRVAITTQFTQWKSRFVNKERA